MTAAFLFTYAFLASILSINALRRPSPPGSRFPPLWLPAMITSELAPLWLGVRVTATGAAAAFGALDLALGRVGAAVMTAAVGLQSVVTWRRRRDGRMLAHHGTGERPAAGPAERLLGRPVRIPDGVEVTNHLTYDGLHTVDVWRPSRGGHGGALLYVHGGGWTGGRPGQTESVLARDLAARGWVVLSIRYPLAPAASFPDQVVAVKRALGWARHGGPGGIDPHRIAIAGGSAGAHLASLAALTAGDRTFQPGFEEADTSVSACVGMYGVYDFLNRHGNRPDWPVIPRAVMKVPVGSDPDAYRAASPVDRVGADAPPFLLVHGGRDSLVPPSESVLFLESLRRSSSRRAELLVVPGAQHAFDAISSPRSRAVAGAVVRFLEVEVLGRDDIDPPAGA